MRKWVEPGSGLTWPCYLTGQLWEVSDPSEPPHLQKGNDINCAHPRHLPWTFNQLLSVKYLEQCQIHSKCSGCQAHKSHGRSSRCHFRSDFAAPGISLLWTVRLHSDARITLPRGACAHTFSCLQHKQPQHLPGTSLNLPAGQAWDRQGREKSQTPDPNGEGWARPRTYRLSENTFNFLCLGFFIHRMEWQHVLFQFVKWVNTCQAPFTVSGS